MTLVAQRQSRAISPTTTAPRPLTFSNGKTVALGDNKYRFTGQVLRQLRFLDMLVIQFPKMTCSILVSSLIPTLALPQDRCRSGLGHGYLEEDGSRSQRRAFDGAQLCRGRRGLAPYSQLVLSAGLPKGSKVTLSAESNAGPVTKEFVCEVPHTDQFVMPLPGAKFLKKVVITFSAAAPGSVSANLLWLGLHDPQPEPLLWPFEPLL